MNCTCGGDVTTECERCLRAFCDRCYGECDDMYCSTCSDEVDAEFRRRMEQSRWRERMDITKLTPGKLVVRPASEIIEHPSGRVVRIPDGVVAETKDELGRTVRTLVADFYGLADAEFFALARRAFDVMMRRGLGVVRLATGWAAALPTSELYEDLRRQRWDCPFTALIEADKWYRENVEASQEKSDKTS